MDDIRRPDPQRRDYSLPRANYAPPANPSAPLPPQPAASAQAEQPIEVAQPPADQAQQQPFTPVAPAPTPDYTPVPSQEVTRTPYQPPEPQVQAQAAAQPKTRIVHFFPYKYVVAAVIGLLILGAAGYFVTRPAKKAGFTADELAKKSTFSFYYPNPMPAGYTYIEEQNAFNDGQAYFMIGKGGKHIVFHEKQTSGSNVTPPSSAKSQTLTTAVGKVVIGTVAGQPAANVLAGSTLISVNTTGGVTQDEVTSAVQSLKAKE